MHYPVCSYLVGVESKILSHAQSAQGLYKIYPSY